MKRPRPTTHAISADGPILQAILDVLHDVYDLLDDHMPQAGTGQGGQVRLTEPARPAPEEPVEPAGDAVKPEPVPTATLPDPPPLAGKGSSRTAWAAWAATAGTPVDDGMSRDDIITACRNAGVLD